MSALTNPSHKFISKMKDKQGRSVNKRHEQDQLVRWKCFLYALHCIEYINMNILIVFFCRLHEHTWAHKQRNYLADWLLIVKITTTLLRDLQIIKISCYLHELRLYAVICWIWLLGRYYIILLNDEIYEKIVEIKLYLKWILKNILKYCIII